VTDPERRQGPQQDRKPERRKHVDTEMCKAFRETVQSDIETVQVTVNGVKTTAELTQGMVSELHKKLLLGNGGEAVVEQVVKNTSFRIATEREVRAIRNSRRGLWAAIIVAIISILGNGGFAIWVARIGAATTRMVGGG